MTFGELRISDMRRNACHAGHCPHAWEREGAVRQHEAFDIILKRKASCRQAETSLTAALARARAPSKCTYAEQYLVNYPTDDKGEELQGGTEDAGPKLQSKGSLQAHDSASL